MTDATNNAATTEEYYYNGDYQLLEVRAGTVASGSKTINANPKERYLRDLSYIDTPAMVELDTNTDGVRDYRLWPTTDANHDVTALVTDQGVTVERYAYTPYGERVVINGDQNYANTGADADGAEWTVDTTGSDFGFTVGFQGLRQDPETSTWQQRARYNSPVVGFQQRDPLGVAYQDGMNLYQFGVSNPSTKLDPLGMCCEELKKVADVAYKKFDAAFQKLQPAYRKWDTSLDVVRAAESDVTTAEQHVADADASLLFAKIQGTAINGYDAYKNNVAEGVTNPGLKSLADDATNVQIEMQQNAKAARAELESKSALLAAAKSDRTKARGEMMVYLSAAQKANEEVSAANKVYLDCVKESSKT